MPEVGIYRSKILRKKERKHAFDQEKSKIQEKKKGRKHAFDYEKKKRKITRFRPRKK